MATFVNRRCGRAAVALLVWFLLMPPATPLSAEAPASQATPAPSTPPATYAKNQLIVKYRDSLTACAHCLFNSRRTFRAATSDRSDSLDRLHQRVQVRAITPVFRTEAEEAVLSRRVGARGPLSRAVLQQAWRDRMAATQARFSQRNRRAPANVSIPDPSHVYLLEVAEGTNIEEALQQYRANPHVEYAQPNYRITASKVPNDPFYHSAGSWGQPDDDLWGLKRIQAEQAWDLSEGQGVVVAVVDSGVDYTHPDLAANIWRNPGEIAGNGLDDDRNGFVDDTRGWDFVQCELDNYPALCPKPEDNDPRDGAGHGTHVAGTIAAVGDNGKGIIGVAPRAALMPVKGLDNTGVGLIDWLAAGILYATLNGADVINNSWGCDGRCPSDPVAETAVRIAEGLGSVVVFAAGNRADDVAFYSPQNMTDPKPIIVAASTQEETATFFSNVGGLVDLAAPGGGLQVIPLSADAFRNVLSLRAKGTGDPALLIGNKYLRQAGTSMAAPHVSGAAALLLAQRPDLPVGDVRHILRLGADDIEGPGADGLTGAGRLNAFRALLVTDIPDVEAELTAPAHSAVLDATAGPLTVTGTASGNRFLRYELFYGQGQSPTTWVRITGPSTTRVTDGSLGSWDLSGLPTDWYVVRLVVSARGGGTVEQTRLVLIQGSVFAIEAPGSQLAPKISGPHIVWGDYRHTQPVAGALTDIYLYDLRTGLERRLTPQSGRYAFLAIGGDWVVWNESLSSSTRLFAYQLSTGHSRQLRIAAQLIGGLGLSGDRVVFEGKRNDNIDVYLYDLRADTEQRLTTDPAFQGRPDISGNLVVWEDVSRGNADIVLYDVSAGIERRLTDNPVGQYLPKIGGTTIAWLDLRYGTAHVVACKYNIVTGACPEQQLTRRGNTRNVGGVANGRVVWEEISPSRVMLHDLVTGIQQPLDVRSEGLPRYPAISGRRVTWSALGAKGLDIFIDEIPSGGNLLSNPQFESGRLDWTGWGPDVQLKTTPVFRGALATMITLRPFIQRLQHQPIAITPGAQYLVRAALKTTGIATGEAYVQVQWLNPSGLILGSEAFALTRGTTDWLLHSSGRLTAPMEANRAQVSLMTDPGNGIAYFDAVRLKRLP